MVTCNCMISLLTRLDWLRGKGYVHGDIRSTSIMGSRFDMTKFMSIDFGWRGAVSPQREQRNLASCRRSRRGSHRGSACCGHTESYNREFREGKQASRACSDTEEECRPAKTNYPGLTESEVRRVVLISSELYEYDLHIIGAL